MNCNILIDHIEMASLPGRDSNIGILIPTVGAPRLITVPRGGITTIMPAWDGDIDSCDYLVPFGYTSCMFVSCDSKQVNTLGSLIAKKMPVYGTCILLDDAIDFTMEEFKRLVTIASKIPTYLWQPEPSIVGARSDTPSGAGVDIWESLRLQGVALYHQAMVAAKVDRLVLWEKLKPYIKT